MKRRTWQLETRLNSTGDFWITSFAPASWWKFEIFADNEPVPFFGFTKLNQFLTERFSLALSSVFLSGEFLGLR